MSAGARHRLADAKPQSIAMKHIAVLGVGCSTCNKTYERIEQVAREGGVEHQLEK